MIGAVTVSVLCGGGADAFAASGVRALEVVSNRADLISGGDALVAARLAEGPTPRRCASTSTAPMSPPRSPCGPTVASKGS